MKSKKILFSFLISFLLLVVFVGWIFSCFSWETEKEEVFFKIEKGDKVFNIGEKLEEEGIIKNSFVFAGYTFITEKNKKLQAGTYYIDSGMNMIEIVDLFHYGKVSFESIIVIEGWSLQEIGDYFQEQDLSSREDFFKITGISEEQATLMGAEEVSEFLLLEIDILKDKPKDASLEGYLFPDTYRISSDDTVEDIVLMMIQNLERKISGSVSERNNLFGKSTHEVIIMASLLEKEVITLKDKRKVADILWRRIEVGMPLQIDATVNYVIGKKGIDITIKETEVDSLYNTYKYKGLPKGPICNPGIESIEAAVTPIENEYWYYLSDPVTGETIFSRNHNEHIQAKNKYL
ncbi:MAG: endolytic transglycosylase MltG [Patescibacteria group bacterium]|nr:endolytic transglycosylase MltG [Patescibacteria group bacterium]